MRQWIVGGAVGVLLLAGCSSGETTSGGDPDTSGGADTSATSVTTAGSPDASGVYVVQEAGRATLTPSGADDELSTLVLSDAQPRSVYFTGLPSPKAGTAPNQEVMDVLYADGVEHDAALSWSSPTDAGTLVVTIVSGAYDEATGALTYQVRPIEASASSSPVVAQKASSTEGEAADAATLPDDVTTSTLFIDPIGQDQAVANCNLTVVNDTTYDGEIADINSEDSDGMVDWDRPFSVGQALAPGASLTAASGDSTWNCHALVGVMFSPLDTYEVYIKLDDPVFSKSSWSCAAPPELQCEITANATRQPMDMTVTISGP